MSIGMKIEQSLKLTQQLVMTPQLQLAIRILQLNTMELQQVVQQELQENPTLEESQFEEVDLPDLPADTTSDLLNAAAGALSAGNGPDSPEAKIAADLIRSEYLHDSQKNKSSDDIIQDDFQREINSTSEDQSRDPETDWDKYFDYMEGSSDITPRETGGEDKVGFEEFLSKSGNLSDHLLWQLHLSTASPDEIYIGEEIIGNVNEDGYLGYADHKGDFHPTTLEEIAEQNNFNLDTVVAVHRRILKFEPYGCGARSLQECLNAQARFLEPANNLVVSLLRDHWDIVQKRKVDKLARVCKCSQKDISAALKIIGALDPKPGRRFSDSPTQYVVPDIYIHKVGDDYHIVLNEDGLPKLRVCTDYQKYLGRNHLGTTETKEYIKGKIRSASWLIRSIQQRQRTIYKVMDAILKRQRDFFDFGVDRLKPMILRDIAEDIGMHECTVSRVTTGKYVHTSQGIFELKYFFNSGITNSDGLGIASESIKTRIRQMVDEEEPRKPLSDQKLVQILKKEGIDVARRTVAKYREMLGILSSSGRRRKF